MISDNQAFALTAVAVAEILRASHETLAESSL